MTGLVDIRLIGAPEPAGQAAARLGELFALDRHDGPYPSRKTPDLVRYYLAGRLHPAPEQTPATPDPRDLLAAVLEALDIPLPATVGDHDRYREVLEDRAGWARVALNRVVAGDAGDLAWEAAFLRERLTEHPPAGYKTGPWPGVPVDGGQHPQGGGR